MNILTTWRLVRRLMAYSPVLVVAHIGLWGVINGSALVPGLIAREIFDDLTGAGRLSSDAYRWTALLGGLVIAQAVLWMMAGYVEIILRFRSSGLVRRNMLGCILRRPGAEALPFALGQTISRFRDDAYEAEDALDWTDEITIQGVFAVIAVVILLGVNVTLTLATALPMILMVLVTQRASAALIQRRATSSEAVSQVSGAIGDTLSAVSMIQLAGAEDRVTAHIRQLGERRRSAILSDRMLGQGLDVLTSNTANIGAAVVMLLAASGLRDGAMSIGDFVLFVSYIGVIAGFTAELGRYLTQQRQAAVAVSRMAEAVGGAPEGELTEPIPLYLRGSLPSIVELPDQTDELDVLEVTGLTYRYPNSDRGIEGIDLELARGSLTVVTGRVGSGKSTLLRVLLGLLPADLGEVRWNREVVTDPADFFTPPRAGYVSQVPRLFSDSLERNIVLGLPADRERLANAVHGAVLADDLDQLPAGIETEVGSRGVKLSGGQVQRTAMARMLYRQPGFIVIDDLSSALDAETERDLWERLRSQPNLTCLAVSHRRAALARADQIIVLARGHVQATGSLAQLLATSAEMRAIWQESDDEHAM